MFLGHFGLGLAAKKITPMISLGTLFLAAQFVDLIWPTLLVLGLEHVSIVPGITVVTPLDFTDYPISHSLLTSIGWGVLLGGIYFAIRREMKGAVVLALLVVSHWILDLLVHRPDLPLMPGSSELMGFGLWNNLIGTLLLESAVFSAGVYLYITATKAKDRIGTLGLWGLLCFFVLIYIANLVGDPPPDPMAIAWVGHAQWIFVLWGYWVDRHRVSVA